ncbi:MAG: ATP-dependent RecD-like DNA helicase [Lachnospiraceae bacterium]|nr:ATP-dependent RecD-like DNA helicase [Lachnospiraceae bacterium]MCI9059700.1 ATP-dependent RecD-like DNA helicase [Lachnospiraceae bacterium]
METLTGYVEHIVFQNTENGYTVLNLSCEGEEITCVGMFHGVSEGEFLEVTGEYATHPSYGQQLKMSSFQIKPPEDVDAMERYLGSGAVKGIGAALAARIVRKFKEDTFRIIEEEPERLAEVKGISQRKAMEIAEQVEGKRELRQAMIFLQQYGISQTLAAKIHKTYGQELYGILRENPYRLADDIRGVGFRIADEIASRIGIHTDSDFRIRSGILYTLMQSAQEGHTCLPAELLTQRAGELLGVDAEHIEKHYMNLAIDKKLVIKSTSQMACRQTAAFSGETEHPCNPEDETTEEGQYIYASSYYYMEANTAAMLKQLDLSYDVPELEIRERIRRIEQDTGMELDELQAEAVKEAVTNGLMVITGGPGTGKTTTINTIIRYFELEGMDIFLAAPTGRAAKRMSETTGFEARTIHRMLELNGGMEGNAGFERNERNPLETDVIIIDEMSMVDISLMYALLKAVAAGTRLILVGDVNQLPSVGPGSVLKDMIESGQFHVVRLNKIFRQAAQSDIIVNAHKINRGEEVLLDNKSMDFFFLKRFDANVIISVVIQLIQQKLPKFVDAEPFDIQVLTPMRKGLLGVERLNGILQQYLNPPEHGKAEREHGGITFREGDKVMQIKNNYQLEWEIRSKYGLAIDKGTGIFNGDTGIIRSISLYQETVTVEFDEGRMVEYSFKQLDELELAYAITIHKSQGSEYPAVVIPLLTGPRMLMNRNLLYTAVTRAKKCVTIVGNDLTFQEMIANVSEQKRYTGLKARLE